ncbi:MAG TPA: hypothetical protein VJ846_01455 [Sphingomicrobium sp.]|nr:hypothetical protein [Sphingomicrobium sp.]
MTETERLRDYIEQLKGVIGFTDDDQERIRRTFPGMEPIGAQMIAVLFKRDFVTRTGLYSILYGARPDNDMPDESVLDTQLCVARRYLKPNGIEVETIPGSGWFMSKASKAKMKKLIEAGPPLDLESVALATDQRLRRAAKKEHSAEIIEFRAQAPLSIPLSITPERREHMRKIGAKGGKSRLKKMSNRARVRAARHAAQMRWAKQKAA